MYIVCAEKPRKTVRREIGYSRSVGIRLAACQACLQRRPHPESVLIDAGEWFEVASREADVFLEDYRAVNDFLGGRWERFEQAREKVERGSKGRPAS